MGVAGCVNKRGDWLCYFLGVTPPPKGKELGENEEQLSTNRDSAFSPNKDSDYHSLSNAPISPGRVSIYDMIT